MLRDLFQLTHIEIQNAPRLYPQGIDWRLKPGVNVIAGGTGLGKTTLVHTALFTIFGALGRSSKRDVEKIDHTYFQGRLVRPNEQQEDAPQARVEAVFGNVQVAVARNLHTGRLISAEIDGDDVDASSYEKALAGTLGLKDFEGEVLGLVDRLLYLAESPHLLAWDSLSQNEVMSILFGRPDDFREVNSLWQKVSSADSEFRNARHQATKVQRQIEALQPSTEASDAGAADAIAARRLGLESARKRAETGRNAAFTRWQQTRDEVEDLERRVADLQGDYRRLAQVLSDADRVEPDALAIVADSPRFASLLDSFAALIEDPSSTRCLCCAQTPQTLTPRLRATRDALSAAQCPVCGTGLRAAKSTTQIVVVAPEVRDAEARIGKAASELRNNLRSLEQAQSRLRIHRDELDRAEETLRTTRDSEWGFNVQHPLSTGSVMDQQHIMLLGLRGDQTKAEEALKRYIAAFTTARDRLNKTLRRLRQDIASAFETYCKLFLDESVAIEFDEKGEHFQRRGPQIDPLHSAFFPIVDGDPRYRADSLSDAQRTFVDLAFRMALLEVWSERQKKPVMLIVETPEGGVDAAYMTRVAELLRKFAQEGHQLIVTTNINNDTFLPELLAKTPRRERPARLLNLLEVGAPRQVQKRHVAKFNKIIDEAMGR